MLLLSQRSIGSSHVGKELERASSKKKQIIAVRLDEAPLTPAFEYFLSESQWVDIPLDGRDAAFAKLAGALAHPPAPGAAPPLPGARAPPPRAHGRAGRGWPSARWRWWPRSPAASAIWCRSPHVAPADANDKSIAVLPFVDMSEASGAKRWHKRCSTRLARPARRGRGARTRRAPQTPRPRAG